MKNLVKITKSAALAGIIVVGGLSTSAAQTDVLQDNTSPAMTTTPVAKTVTSDLKLDRSTVEADRRDKMYNKLNLSEEQRSQMDLIAADRKEASQAIKNTADLNKEEKRTKLKSLRDETLAKIQDILSDEQYAQYLQMAKKGLKGMGKRGARGGGQ